MVEAGFPDWGSRSCGPNTGIKERAPCVDSVEVSHEADTAASSSAGTEFTLVRKGYEPAEVDKRLAEYEGAVQELEEYTKRLQHELKAARREIARLAATEQESIERGMAAVLNAKERIMEQAMARARQIEDEARSAVGQSPSSEEAGPPAEDPAAALEKLIVGMDAPDPNAVLEKMLEEAEAIRNRLDDGLAAAFDEMEQMRRDAELRAADLIAEARHEAAQLRAAAATQGPEVETAIAVNLTGAEERPSRYSRNSASLPRIGEDSGASILATMNDLRTKMREDEDSSGA